MLPKAKVGNRIDWWRFAKVALIVSSIIGFPYGGYKGCSYIRNEQRKEARALLDPAINAIAAYDWKLNGFLFEDWLAYRFDNYGYWVAECDTDESRDCKVVWFPDLWLRSPFWWELRLAEGDIRILNMSLDARVEWEGFQNSDLNRR